MTQVRLDEFDKIKKVFLGRLDRQMDRQIDQIDRCMDRYIDRLDRWMGRQIDQIRFDRQMDGCINIHILI